MMQMRTHTCGELRLANAGQRVKIVGWMENVRVVGQNFAFVVLRDFYGTTQVVAETEDMLAIIKGLNKESTISVEGVVRERASKNPKLATGEIEVVPGITAACGGAAVLGAPLTHDFAVVSLSDLLTPWEKITARLTAAAQADFVLCLYNPASHSRPDYLQRACDILLSAGKDPATVCGTVRNIGRAGEEAALLTLGELRDTQVDMFTTVFVGNSQTKVIGGKMVTPRGYLQRGE